MHALIIEDQFLIAALIEDVLRGIGYKSFDIVDREDDAVRAAGARRPDLVMADQQLAAGTGVDAVRAILGDGAVPVVFISDYWGEVGALAPEAVCIAKPFGERTVREAVRQAVALTGTATA